MTARNPLSSEVMDVRDLLAAAINLNEALFLAQAGIGNLGHTNALQSVSDELNNKLLIISDRLEKIQEALA
ncbi:hypothetical protein ACQKKX_02265 [Neorhizobium sp. NPDC001467]|uniref:hypothetical protein n=1 Tax=Neorhizobium sp. NPDC001467 TaxID=3390595 RepID=UPI003CFE83B9